MSDHPATFLVNRSAVLQVRLAAGLVVSACAAPSTPPVPESACVWLPGVEQPSETLTVAVAERFDPAVPQVDGSDGWTFVAHQLYDTPVRLDCEDRLYPGVVTQWQRVDQGAWELSHLDSVVTSIGSEAVHSLLTQSWGGADHDDIEVAPGGVTIFRGSLASLAGEDRFLVVQIGSTSGGTGPYILAGRDESSDEVRYVLAPRVAGWPTVVVRSAPGADGRDLMDDGADVVLTRDRTVHAYAQRHPGFVERPLNWNRTYAFVSSQAAAGLDAALDWPATATSLADRTLGTGARPAFVGVCEGTGLRPNVSNRMVYHEGDETARTLAERLVSLATRAEGGSTLGVTRVEALPHGVFEAALSTGAEGGFIVTLGHEVTTCSDVGQAVTSGFVVVPLVATRPVIVARTIAQPIRLDANGVVRLVSPREPR